MTNNIEFNNTSRFPDDLVRALIAFVGEGVDYGYVGLNVKNSGRSFRGRAYEHIPSISNWSGKLKSHLVLVCIGKDKWFPIKNSSYPGMKRAPVYDINDAVECFVVVLAHELQHCEQFEKKRRHSEIEAEHAAVRALERFRAARATLGVDAMMARGKPGKPKPAKLPELWTKVAGTYDGHGSWWLDAPDGFNFDGMHGMWFNASTRSLHEVRARAMSEYALDPCDDSCACREEAE